jgi:hypothetical protein
MLIHVETPALRASQGPGVPNSDLAGGSIGSESTSPLRDFQARQICRRHAVSLATAFVVASLVHGEPAP